MIQTNISDTWPVHADSVLATLDAAADEWFSECDIGKWIARMTSDARSADRLKAFARQCFVEGAYRGACNAADAIREAEREAEFAASPRLLNGLTAKVDWTDRELDAPIAGSEP